MAERILVSGDEVSRWAGADGSGQFAGLAIGGTTTVQCTIAQPFADADYSVIAVQAFAALNILSNVQVLSTTPVDGTRCDVQIKNNGLVSLSGVVILRARHN